ncbi:MAG: DUF2157 domain-containing protein [Alphaproteobacteria bacterium]|nr:DUF2157 domain-containing protein [Alphaproteobacteria bacterium]
MEKIEKKENYWETVLLYFASFLVGLGMIAEVAANWQQIPNEAKLIGALVLMIVNVGAIVISKWAKKNLLMQVFTCIYAFLIAGVIGLIGQVFQLHSDVAKGCLFWSLISWPLFLIVPQILWLWIPLFFFGVHYLPPCLQSLIGEGIFSDWNSVGSMSKLPLVYLTISTIAVYALFLIYEYFVCVRNGKNSSFINPLKFYSAVLMWGLYCRASSYAMDSTVTIGFVREILVPCIVVGCIIYAVNRMFKRESFMPIFLLGVVLQWSYVFVLNDHSTLGGLVSWVSGIHSTDTDGLPLIFWLIALAYSWYHKMPRLQKICVLALITWLILTLEDNIFSLIPCLIYCAIIAFFAYRQRNKKWFNTAIIMAVLRILFEYADVQNLQYFGMYLVGSGLLIIVTVLFLTKYNRILWEKKDEK